MNCQKCFIELNEINIVKRKDSTSGYRLKCKPCDNARKRAPLKECEYCKKMCNAKGKRFFCSVFCRLKSYCTIDPITKCWNYREKWRDKDGYGIFIVNNISKRAHRVSYELFKGPIVNNLYVCHACDNPSCTNPDHLWLGTNSENQLDRFNKRFLIIN